jgi:quinohemoprotein amine dehydrogenase
VRSNIRQATAVVLVLAMWSTGALAGSDVGPALQPIRILVRRCGSCHAKLPDGGYARLTTIRKTPEAWDMTIHRMTAIHDVEIPSNERAALVKYLADTQGLAPEEAAPYRYLPEKRPNYLEQFPNERLGLMCGSCHTYARAGLQRRSEEEWLKLAHFHLGQFPSLEYQSRLRSVEWWKIATLELPQDLAKRFPAESGAWKQWREHKAVDLSGEWRVVGREPSAGDYRGTLTIAKSGDDRYSVRWALTASDGKTVSGDGDAIVYTGFEWRASATLGGKDVRQVLAVSPDGDAMTGRWFYRDNDEHGGDLNAVRVKAGTSAILAVQPPVLRVGAKTQLTIVGFGLSGDVGLGDGIKVVETVSSAPNEMVVIAEPDGTAPGGTHDVAVGSATGKSLLTVYHKLDSVRIEPEYGIARVGGNGGPIAAVPAQFEAVGYLNGPDGKAGTADDVRIGVVAAKWSVAPFDDAAAEKQDVKYAGQMDAASGLFTPAGAGPNPQRRFGANNTGNLKVLAAVDEDGTPLRANAQLIVTVQRWVDPPLR